MLSPYSIRLPSIMHKVIDGTYDRVIIVGDVHGCYDELMKLLDKVGYCGQDLLVLVGDLVMKGPKSLEVVRFCAANNVLAVRGNVDENSLKHYEDLQGTDDWGAYEWMKDLSDQELEYMYELPYTIKFGNNLVVHAGLLPGVELEDQDLDNLIRMRNVYEENELKGTSRNDIGTKWIDHWKGPEHIYFGHDARRRFQSTEHATGLDTAACYGNELTCCVIEGDDRSFVSVPSGKYYG